jgi:hypothetical protein
MRRNDQKRKGYILAAVLGMTAVVTALGISYLEATSTVMPESVNRYGSMRALYMAESGVAIGSRYLMFPPTSVALDAYWLGSTNMAVDSTNDRTDVSISQPSEFDRNLYRIVAAGYSYGPLNESRGKRSVTADVVVPPNGKWYFTHAMIATGATHSVLSKTTINGNVHGNGALTGFGSCRGAVTATLTALWLGSGPPASVTSLAPSVSVPTTTISKYRNYTIWGQNYAGYTGWTDDKIDSASDAAALNAINMTATNPGRIIIAKTGTYKIKNINLTGCLVVNGDLQVENSCVIQAVNQFPALVVTGDIVARNDNSSLQVNGTVICNGKIDGSGKNNFVVSVNGTTICKNGAISFGLGGSVTLAYDANRAYMWDFDNPPATKPITVVSWKED